MAWTETTEMNTPRQSFVASANGTTSDAIVFGGGNPGTTAVAVAEKWNGSAWTEVGDLNDSRHNLAGAGSSSSGAIAMAGEAPSFVTSVETFDGTSWTEVADVSTGKTQSAGTGSETSGLYVGGATSAPAVNAGTEEWDFTSTLGAGAWATGGALNTG